jgi:hypothetical protein
MNSWLRKPWLAPVLAGFILAGCATAPRIDWAARIGNYTYDQAVLDFGPPVKSAKLSDGTIVADWLKRRGEVVVTPEPYPYIGPPGYFVAPYPAYYNTTSFPPVYRRLIFGPDGRLKQYKEVE